MDAAPLRPGAILADRYRIDRLLGSGGMSQVFLARDTELGRDVALKVFPDAVADDVRRQRDEARVLASLHHPGLVVLFDAQLSARPPFLTMEYVPGESLDARLTRTPGLPATDAEAIVRDVAAALAYVHERGVIHRDIKPANILLPPDGEARAKLADFGIARLMSAEKLTATGTVLGTAAYISPEQASGKPVGAPSDVYSLGLVFIEALTGARSFGGTALEAAAARLSSDPDLSATELAPYRSLLSGMTARDPESRPTASEVIADLDGASATRALPAVTQPLHPAPIVATEPLVPSTPDAPRPRTRARLIGVLAAAAVASLFCISVAVLTLAQAGTPAPGPSDADDDVGPVSKVIPETAVTEPQPEHTPPDHGPKHPKKPGKPGKGP